VKRSVRKLAWILVLCCGSLTWWACRSRDGIPADLAPAQVLRPPAEIGAVAELVWGGWHPVPWDPRAADALERAYRLQLQGEHEDAIAALNTGLTLLPGSASLIQARGALYAVLGYRRAAARDFEETTELAPDRASAWCGLGRMRQELGLENEALAALEQATALGLDDAELHLTLARAYHGLARQGRAAGHYALALARTPNPPYELQVEAAGLFFEDGETTPEAVDRALGRMALELPTDPAAEARMWEVHALLRDLGSRDAETIAAGLAALDVDPEALSIWTRLSLLAVQLDDAETLAEIQGGVAQGPANTR